jgi:hypothetical protein
MNKKTMFYGLIAIGVVLAYYAYKQHKLSLEQKAKDSASTATFVDDVPVNPSVLGVSDVIPPKSFVPDVKGGISSVTEPFTESTEE